MGDDKTRPRRSPALTDLAQLGYDSVAYLECRSGFHSQFPGDGPSLHFWTLEILRPLLDRARLVVDVAAGLGAFWQSAMRDPKIAWPDKHVVWCDLAPSMIRILSTMKRKNISILRCDMDNLPIGGGCVDLLLCHSALHYSANPSALVGRLQAHLSAGGSLSIMASGSGNMAELHSFFDAGDYGIDLSQRPLARFHEPELDELLGDATARVQKSVWISTLRVDKDNQVADYFISHPEVRSSVCVSTIREDLIRRMRQHLAKYGSLCVRRRQCHYLVKND